MTLAKRINIARILTMVQMVIPACVFIVGAVFFVFLAMGMSDKALPVSMVVFVVVAFLIVTIIGVGLPWIVLNAIKVRNEKWAMAAFVSLILQIVCGGGVLSVLPIITLVLLVNEEASNYIGMK